MEQLKRKLQKRANMKKTNKEQFDRADWNIAKETFDETYAKILSRNPKRLETFKKRIINDYNNTKNMPVFLMNLKIIALAHGNIAELARKSNMKRPNIYRFLSQSSNPTFSNLLSIVNNLGIDFVAKRTA